MTSQQAGSDKRYFADEIKALYRSTDVEKRAILIHLKYHELIKVDLLGISINSKECLFVVFDMSAIYILCSL